MGQTTVHAHIKSSVRPYRDQYLHQQCKETGQREIRLRHFEKANSPQDYQIYFIHIQKTSNADICNPLSAMRANVRATHSTLFYGIKGERKHLQIFFYP